MCASAYDTHWVATWWGIARGEWKGLEGWDPVHQLCLMPGNLNFLCTFLAQKLYTHSYTYICTCLCVSVQVCANHFEFDLLPICWGFVLNEYSGMALVPRPTNFPWRQQCEWYLYDHICHISEWEILANSNFSNTRNTLNCIMQSHLLCSLR